MRTISGIPQCSKLEAPLFIINDIDEGFTYEVSKFAGDTNISERSTAGAIKHITLRLSLTT